MIEISKIYFSIESSREKAWVSMKIVANGFSGEINGFVRQRNEITSLFNEFGEKTLKD